MTSTQRICVLLLLGGAFVIGNSWQFAGAQGEKPKGLPKWEISKVTRSAEGWVQSQAMAGEGWELVTVDATAYYLKRPKQ